MSREEALAQSNLDVREVDIKEGGGDGGEGKVSLKIKSERIMILLLGQTLTHLLLD